MSGGMLRGLSPSGAAPPAPDVSVFPFLLLSCRKIMDSGELDFYQHTKVCSNTCRSTKIDLTGARVSLTSQTSTEYIPLTPASADGRCSDPSTLAAGALKN